MSSEEYKQRAHELKLDNDWYYKCLKCKEIMHQTLTKNHQCIRKIVQEKMQRKIQKVDEQEEETKESETGTFVIETNEDDEL